MELDQLTKEFVAQCVLRMEENKPRIRKCLDQLTEEEVWARPNPASNSIANLLLHLNGNITQYILSALGKLEDKRLRDEEFSTKSGYSKDSLLKKHEATVNTAVSVLKRMTPSTLLEKRSVQGFELSGVGIIVHVVEHYSYHTGQIAFWTKALKNNDLGFYAGVDLNKKNKI